EDPVRRVFNLHAVWEAELAGHVVIAMHESVAVYDKKNHAVQSGYTVLGLDDEHTVSIDYVRCDSEGSYLHAQGLNVSNVGVYYYTAEVAILNKTTGENETIRYDIRITVGFLTIVRNTDYSSVVIKG
ncbi:MAG: hypothetical protein MJZ38_06995, partial [archaeon]|nr:hypothetical protein [archaeon]